MTSSVGTRTALLVIHLQNDIVSPGTAFGGLFNPEYEARGVLAQVNSLASAVRAAGGLVVPARVAWQEGYADLNPAIPLLAMVQGAGALVDGSHGAALVEGFELDPADLVLTHTRPGPFTGSDLAATLRDRGIERVLVAGVATNASVEGAVRQAADLDFVTAVVADASSAADASAHEASIASMGLVATVTTVAEAIDTLA